MLDQLPAGEWADIQILNNPPGMMARKDWAVFAKAKWLRDGKKKAYIKFIVGAGSGAGASTQLVTDATRLNKLYNRLQRIGDLGDAVPSVPLLDLQLAPSGLLIVMEEVTPLRS